jgi:hypothetical protein
MLLLYLERAPSQTLLFKSGFEEGVYITSPGVTGGQWWQTIAGQDAGFNWLTDLPSLWGYGYFFYMVDSDSSLNQYVETRLDTVIGPRGIPTRVLYQEVKAYHPANFNNSWGHVRNSFFIPADTNRNQGYMRYWLKFQSNLESVMPAGGAIRSLQEQVLDDMPFPGQP